MSDLVLKSEHRCHGGVQTFHEHRSVACAGPMRFSVFLPPAAVGGARVPVLYVLAGLTCTEETFAIKAGAQRVAAELGLALVTCDTSPRSARFPGDDASWDFGLGAAYYIDATQPPWSSAYRMESYVTEELPEVVEAHFPVASERRGILGHSVGGHGALTLALRHPDRYRSVSAFSPMVAPSQVPWGIQAFGRLLGPDRARWAEHDATELVKRQRFPGVIRIDQGTADQFLATQLRPELFSVACAESRQPLELRMREGYDHGYWFIQSFVEEHLRHHAAALTRLPAGPDSAAEAPGPVE
ncbi:MAG TPA: S-formylglutathione hydrolase [Myxococcaceae bacterium]|nr:S-formylglutathione hydrolase [Myxococcaceae bacterium]